VNFRTLEVCLAVAAVVAVPADASSLFSVGIQRTTVFDQTSGAAPTSPTNVAVFFSVDPPGDFTSGSVDSPSTINAAQLGPGLDGGGSPDLQSMEFDFGSQADALAQFPNAGSVYTFNLVDSNNTSENTSVQMTDISTSASLDTPAATSTTWNGLQGLDATQDFTFGYNADTKGGLDFLEIVQCSDATCDSFVSLAYFNTASPGNTSFDLPASTFLPGTPYLAALFFTSATGVPCSSGEPSCTGTLTELNNETNMTFETMANVPEPGTWLSLLTGLAGLAIWRRRRAS